jgi:hypothetical protein
MIAHRHGLGPGTELLDVYVLDDGAPLNMALFHFRDTKPLVLEYRENRKPKYVHIFRGVRQESVPKCMHLMDADYVILPSGYRPMA